MIHVLLVDDESYVTESLAQTLPWEECGVSTVYQAASAQEALTIMEEQDVDILVTDIRMPGMDGLELIEEVASRWPNVRSMVLTGHSDFEYAKKAIQLQAFDYVLKPVNDEEFLVSLGGAIESLKDEWEAFDKMHKMHYNRKSDFTVLRAHLMHDLVLGRQLSPKTIQDKLQAYEIPFQIDTPTVMLLIQPDRYFSTMDHHSLALMEYAIGNIAEEVFAETFQVLHCTAPHDCLMLVAQLKEVRQEHEQLDDRYRKSRRELLQRNVESFQRNVSNYLKGHISITVTRWFTFPQGIPDAYKSGLSSIYQDEHAMTEMGAVMYLEDGQGSTASSVRSLEGLYRPPALIHLLESKQWDSARAKLEQVYADMEQESFSREHLYEVFLSVTNAFMYIAHKQGRLFYQLNQSGIDPMISQGTLRSLPQLREWSLSVLDSLESDLSENEQHTKSYVIKQVQDLIFHDQGQELSVKTLADQVYLHPVYLSKIYKAETGEGLGDYIIRMRMEKALYLLKHTNKKIYEITTELGYQNPQYFSKMFKKHYGMTPNEFRDQ